jgi:hypothetical protein
MSSARACIGAKISAAFGEEVFQVIPVRNVVEIIPIATGEGHKLSVIQIGTDSHGEQPNSQGFCSGSCV